MFTAFPDDMEQKGIGSFGFLEVLVLQWNSYPRFLIYVRSKSKVGQNISDLQEWQQNTQSGSKTHKMVAKHTKWQQNTQNAKSIFMQRFIYSNLFKTTTLG